MIVLHGRRLFLFLLLVTLLGVCCIDEQTLLIWKCCSENQHFNDSFSACVDYPGHSGGNTTDSLKQDVVDVIQGNTPGFPWWMDDAVNALHPDTLQVSLPLLEGQKVKKYVQMGPDPPCQPHVAIIVNTTDVNYALLHNGSLLYRPPEGDGVGVTYAPHSYCTDRHYDSDTDKATYVYVICPFLNTECVKKCCSSPDPNLQLHEDGSKWECEEDSGTLSGKYFQCSVNQLNSDGRRHLMSESEKHADEHKNLAHLRGCFCTDGLVGSNGSDSTTEMVCNEIIDVYDYIESTLYVYLSIISMTIYLITLSVFLVVPEIRTIKSNMVIYQIIGLILVDITNIQHYMADGDMSENMCVVNAYVVHFANLVAAFWVNVLCIDMAWTFSGLRRSLGQDKEKKKLMFYSIYAWGCPVVICVVTIIMGVVQGIPDSYITPDINLRHCWFNKISAMWAYHYGPLTAVGIVNIPLQIFIVVKILKALLNNSKLHKNGSASHTGSSGKANRLRLLIYLNLFFAIGPPRILLTIQLLVDNDALTTAIDVFIMIRAVFMFLFVCCKRNVLLLLKQRLFTLCTCTLNLFGLKTDLRKDSTVTKIDWSTISYINNSETTVL